MPITARFARVFLLLSLSVLLLSAGVASADAATPSDMRTSGEIIASSGDQLTVRLTRTNLGPGAADAQGGGEVFPGDPPYGFEVSLQVQGIEVVSQPPGCRVAEGIFPIIYCFLGDRFAPGESRSVDFVVRVLPGTTEIFVGANSQS